MASPLRRFGAFLADSLIIGLLVQLVSHFTFSGDARRDWVLAVMVAANAIIGTALWGQTLGKAFVRIRVVAVGTDEPPGWWRAAVRFVVPASSWLLVGASGRLFAARLVPVVVYAPILWDPLRRGLHDRVAGTVVIDAG